MHYTVELGIVLRGCMEVATANKRWTLRRGEVWLTRVWEPHSFTALEQRSEIATIVAVPQVLARLPSLGQSPVNWLAPYTVPAANRPTVPEKHREKVARIGEELREFAGISLSPAQMRWIHLRLMELLLILMDSWSPPVTQPAASDHNQAAVAKALEIVFSQKMPVRIADVSRACKMSERTFHRVFRNALGISFGEFGLRYRLAGAADQLRATADPVKKVAYEWGFRNSAHLDHLMRKHYGCTPTEYRLSARGGKATAGPDALPVPSAARTASKAVKNHRAPNYPRG